MTLAQRRRHSRESGNPASSIDKDTGSRVSPTLARDDVAVSDRCDPAGLAKRSFDSLRSLRMTHPLSNRGTCVPAQKILRLASLAQDDAVVSDRARALRVALGHP